MPLSLAVPGAKPTPNPTSEKLAHVKGEVVSSLEDKIEELRQESEHMLETMTQVLIRISRQGLEARLEDLRTGRWHRVAAEVRLLQDILQAFD